MDEHIQPHGELVCGIPKEFVEKALYLIRDNYRKADEACFFLEERAGINNIQAITNVRDATSHIVTLLNKPDLSNEQREVQLGNAEEHLRRAIIEPYEIAIDSLTKDFYPLYLQYRERLLPVKARHTVLGSAPNSISIDARLREIQQLTVKGREGKGKNLWDPAWEEGISAFIDAFDKLFELKAELETHWYNYEQIGRDRRQIWLAAWGIIATLTTFILGILLLRS